MQIGRLTATFKLEKEYYPQLFAAALILFAIEFAFGRWEFAVRFLFWPLLGAALLGSPIRAVPNPTRASPPRSRSLQRRRENAESEPAESRRAISGCRAIRHRQFDTQESPI